MFCQLFGKYLIEKDILKDTDLSSIMEKLQSSRAKLGVLAIAQGYITEEDASEINKIQTQRDARFGTIATEEGFMTEEQLQTLLDMQGNTYSKFITILADDYKLEISKIDELLKDFQKINGFDDNEFNGLKNDDLDAIIPIYAFSSKSYITDICNLALKNIIRFVTDDFYIDRIKHVNQIDYRCLAGQKLVGDIDIAIAFAVIKEEQAFIDISNGFSGENGTTLGLDAYDSIGEFVNCISGLFATAISKKGINVEIQPQFFYENQSAKGEGYILPIYIHGVEVDLYISVTDDVSLGDMPMVRKIQAKSGGNVTLDSKGTVVIVDDSGMSRKILRAILEGAGYAVLAEATDGLEGVLAYKEHDPDIITLDITMPNMDGTQALKEIMSYDENAKVIMITAAGQQNKVIEALKLGAKRFVTKPFDEAEILKNINEIIEE